MLVMWLSVRFLGADRRRLHNRLWEFWVIYSKLWTTRKILSPCRVLNAPFVCPFLPRGSLITQNAALDIGNRIALGKSREQNSTVGNVLGRRCSSVMMRENGTGHATEMHLLYHLEYTDHCVNLNNRYFGSVWVSPFIYWSIVGPPRLLFNRRLKTLKCICLLHTVENGGPFCREKQVSKGDSFPFLVE